MINNSYLISAIVSVYNCERFIRGCLEDLENQTIADKLEIVVVNTGSQQDEEKIVKEFQQNFNNIVYIRIENRETIYQAWNRGIRAASGKYITNANSDDRHRIDALEIMVAAFEDIENIDLVYADSIVTNTENETFENYTLSGYLDWPESIQYELANQCCIGPQPMWRKALHQKFGYFDESLKVAGDYDFWLRLSGNCRFKHIKKRLGLYFWNPVGAEHINFENSILESENVSNKYRKGNRLDKVTMEASNRGQSVRIFHLGKFYLEKKHYFLSLKTFSRSIAYDWRHFQSYKRIIICLLQSIIVITAIRIKNFYRIVTK